MLVLRRVRNRQDVLDVLQETHLAIWKSLHSYDASRSLDAWLASIALNKCRDWARRRSVRRCALARMQADSRSPLENGTPSAERIVIGNEEARGLRKALDELPRQLREPLLLTTLRDMPQCIVARQLQLTTKAVEMRIRRARIRLQQALQSAPA